MKHGAAYGLELVDEPPAPQRDVTTKADQPDRYVAPDSHRAHGTYVKYVVEKCRCDPCRAANRDYKNRRQHAIRRPDETWVPYVPAQRARQHIADLRRHGIGLKTIAKASGVSHGALSKIVYGNHRGRRPSKRIRSATEAKILAVGYEHAADGCKVPAGPTWTLLDDLIARNYPKVWIARALGQTGPGLQIKRTLVRASTARAVKALHDSLGDQPGPGRRSRWAGANPNAGGDAQ